MEQYTSLNEIYMTPGLKERLREMGRYPLTLISAPTGYGKTTAVRWWSDYLRRYRPKTALYRVTAADDDLNRFWEDLCRLLQRDYPVLSEKMLNMGYPGNGHSMFLLAKLWTEAQQDKKSDWDIYIVIDDAHILPRDGLVPFLFFLLDHIPDRLHFILLSRSQLLTRSQLMRLGRSVYQIPGTAFQLDQEGVLEYARCCGLPLDADAASRLCRFSGGWVSLIYLIFCNFAQTGQWRFETADIGRLIDEVMLEPLPLRDRDFLTVCSVVPAFTEALAARLWNEPDTGALLGRLMRDNAFIFCDTEGVYRCHNLLRRNTRTRFEALPAPCRSEVWNRLGGWERERGDHLAAMTAYRRAENWEALMDTVVLDRGSSFGATHKELVQEWFTSCPEAVLDARPGALLILALQYFSSGELDQMTQVIARLEQAVAESRDLSEPEKNNFSGEVQLLLSFLRFNSIRGMSEHHRAACALMDRVSAMVNHQSPWTFGSPSVLVLYHRESGALEQENRDMQTCMPYYYQLTDGHGFGAEQSMQAETELLRGRFEDAEISYYQAARASQRKRQSSIFLTAEFTAMRLELLRGKYEEAVDRLKRLREMLEDRGEVVLLPTVDLCAAWMGAFLGRKELVPRWITEEDAADNMMVVVTPVFLLVQGEALLTAGEWTRLLACGEEFKAVGRGTHMPLCQLYCHIQLAAACEKLDRRGKALEELEAALDLALPDGLLLPFAEHGEVVRPLLLALREQRPDRAGLDEILALCDHLAGVKHRVLDRYFGREPDWDLSRRELEIARLAARRLTRKEIAEQLFLSENTVKVHLKHIFDKMEIPGNERNKSALLSEKMNLD